MSTFWASIIGFVVGAGVGVGACWLIRARVASKARQTREEELSLFFQKVETLFSSLSRQALSANSDDFLKLAKPLFDQQTALGDQTLEGKKRLIDARLEEMGTKLGTLNSLIQSVEKQRAEAQGALQRNLETNADATRRLQSTTAQLREALANPQRRGQWGERMAEDVLHLAGFIEGVNYHKQQVLSDGGKPDFTFVLPSDRLMHMDVKFPLVNYLKVLDAGDDMSRAECTTQFLRDVRRRIKEVTGREYIDPAAGTVDYVLVFIPNEQVYGFIHEHDAALLDDAMRSKVVLCSPLTLYAILAVVRQAVENFRFEQGSKRILEHLAEFQKQWGKFVESMEKMGRKLEEARNEFDELKGTRTRLLERQLDKIEDLRAAREESGAAALENASRSV